MDFPQGCTSDADRAEYALGVVAVLEEEQAITGQAMRDGEISKAEYKTYFKNDYLPRWKHARHLADLYMGCLKTASGKKLKGQKDVDPESDDQTEIEEAAKALKDKAKDFKSKNKFKDHFKDKKGKDLVEKWTKDNAAAMNAAYKSLQERAQAG